jgi:hypothetical protein
VVVSSFIADPADYPGETVTVTPYEPRHLRTWTASVAVHVFDPTYVGFHRPETVAARTKVVDR